MKVAIIGTVGVPACYGGFETLAENLIGDNCSPDIEYTVFCSSKDMPSKPARYKNADLKYIPFKANGVQSLIYDTISLLRVMRGYDVILYLGAAVPIPRLYKWLCKGKIVLNIDGLSQFRDKYGKFQKKYLAYIKNNEITRADIIVADNRGIQEYVEQNYRLPSELIAYGGDQAIIDMDAERQNALLEKYGLRKGEYSMALCRIEPENNCHLVLEAFAQTDEPLIFIGNWNKSEYGRSLREQYKDSGNIIIHDPVYELEDLYALRANARRYVHGHSVGGTNPSLVEAMFFGVPLLCYDVKYNRATTFNKAQYFSDADELKRLLASPLGDGSCMRELAYEHYTWKKIAGDYENAYRKALKLKQRKNNE